MITCLQCGQKLDDNAKICTFCKNPVSYRIACNACNNLFSKSFNYCPNCGTQNPKDQIQQQVQNAQNQFPQFKMIKVEAGSFIMGEKSKLNKNVTLSPFQISNLLITQNLYGKIMGTNPSKNKNPNNPVECISWQDAVTFCNELSRLYKKNPCYTIDNITDLKNTKLLPQSWQSLQLNLQADGFRLPTEAEWEYAALGGQYRKNFPFSGSFKLEEVGWFAENSEIRPHEVAQKKPNTLELYDMSGNVEEWCYDGFAPLSNIPENNPTGEKSNSKVKRGGSWLDDDVQCKIENRTSSPMTAKGPTIGFRICCSVI